MATAKSVEITALDATPREVLETGSLEGRMRVASGTIAAGTGDIDNDDVLMMVQIPSNAKVLSIKVFNDDLDSNGSPTLAANVGLYQENGTVLDEDCYATTITTLQAAKTAGVEVAFEARNVNAVSNFSWEGGGL